MRVYVVDLGYTGNTLVPAWVGVSTPPTKKKDYSSLEAMIKVKTKQNNDLRYGTDYDSMIADIKKYKFEKIAIGFEAPMYTLFELKERFEQEKDVSWHQYYGPQATSQSRAHGHVLINKLAGINYRLFTTNNVRWDEQRILLFEGIAAGVFKPRHIYKSKVADTDFAGRSKTIGKSTEAYKEDLYDAFVCAMAFLMINNPRVKLSKRNEINSLTVLHVNGEVHKSFSCEWEPIIKDINKNLEEKQKLEL